MTNAKKPASKNTEPEAPEVEVEVESSESATAEAGSANWGNRSTFPDTIEPTEAK